jgi:hypothetical protein
MPPSSSAAPIIQKSAKKVKEPKAPQDRKDIKGVVADDSNPYAVPRYPL